jgi:hypothetical protein
MKTAAIVGLLVTAIGVALYVTAGEARIRADTLIALAASPSADAVVEMPAGTELSVTRCVDTKHYIVPEVVDADGATWFVVGGRFHFVDERRPWGC